MDRPLAGMICCLNLTGSLTVEVLRCNKARIFEPFFTTKGINEGTGLGLDTVSRIVRHHHGNLRFESKPGDTCFQIRLPLKPEAAPKNNSPGASEEKESDNGN